jgi:ribosomal-protein-alanine N-acetyltransferase
MATLRNWVPADQEALVATADDRAVWRNMTDVFPHPYAEGDARQWIERCLAQEPPKDLVVSVQGQLAGVCGIELFEGVSAYTGRIGYWLGQHYWNQGIATAALESFLAYIWETFEVERLQAEVFAWNPASARVLEKNGFELEGTRRRAIFKDGQLIDEWMYVLFRPAVPNP